MIDDPWRQWQSLFANSLGAMASAQTRSAREATSAFGPFVDAAERYAAAVRSFVAGAAGTAASGAATPGVTPEPSATAASHAAKLFSDFLREQFADVQMPWSAGINPAVGAPRAPSAREPALGATREQQLRLQRMANAWLRIDEAQRRLQRLWSDALREAATAFATRMKPPPALSAEEMRKFYNAWIDCAEDAYARTARTEAYCTALAELVNASSEWRRELQADIEHWAKLLDLPTRGEINTLLRRLKSVEEQLRDAKGEHQPHAAAPLTVSPVAAAKGAAAPSAVAPGAAARQRRDPAPRARPVKRVRRKSKS
ncbi:MAG TPA: poly(R)-hydroxyalkanoic acid synthase subunit PhaE [Steroidobacteraceae bacterium]|nr:poly(R)-hydroxyalkanoic acid synthase subunit PhaE [Steroidobacteraceae bacterium]